MTALRPFLALLLSGIWTIAGAQPTTTFVFAKIIDTSMPLERASKYEDPLNAALKEAKLGEVTGGGTMTNKDRKIEWVGVDMELTDLERGIPFVKNKLRQLGAPKGSKLEYEANGKKVIVDIAK